MSPDICNKLREHSVKVIKNEVKLSTLYNTVIISVQKKWINNQKFGEDVKIIWRLYQNTHLRQWTAGLFAPAVD